MVRCRSLDPEDPMQTPQPNETVATPLAPEQKEQDRPKPEQESDAAKLAVEELEERVAPRLAANHNETLLVDQ
jgi:hypothetical protein